MKTSVINKNSGDYGKLTNVQYSKDLAFATGRWQDLVRNGELTSLAVNDATVDAGITLLANYEYLGAWISNAVSAITLPKATEGTFIAYVNTADADEASAMTITAASGDTYEPYQEVHIGTGIPAQQDVSIAADSVLTITCAATNGGWGQIGSNFMLYCKNEGEWLVDVNGVSKGTGATATIAFS
jgi:hypothetical protein|tara:strand:+ start:118 stop:672 length:555 start_codon:yes stop_codon:yes gene_type:complete